MKNSLKRGKFRFYFPEFPDHPLNGSYAAGTDARVNSQITNELDSHRQITTFENSEHNKNSPSGYWEGEFDITAQDFNSEKVLVKYWFDQDFPLETEYFYLIK